ncbi:hypothetical protein Tco_0937176 [Tanacetum coccineum]|uniref:Uncharacterized protein n=1 Tax=Tanacetum coccineum TaxID=301880 RepID=A0ABQ5DDK9_9ASTR
MGGARGRAYAVDGGLCVIHAGCLDSRISTFGSAQYLEIDWLSGPQRSKRSTANNLQLRLNTLPCLDVVLKSFGCDHSSKTMDLTSIKFLCTVITKVQLLFAVTMSSTLDQSTSTYVTISSESKWKIEWLNSTSWKRTINLRTFSQKHYQENDAFKKEKMSKRSAFVLQPGSLSGHGLLKIHALWNTMAEQNVPAQAPTRTDEQIISVDILRNTNFFRAFSASASVPAIYIQQFWNSMKTVMGRVYSRDSDILLTQGNDGIIKRPESPCHLPGDDFLLASKQPEPATRRAPPKKPTTTTPVKPTKPPSSKQPKSPTKKPSKRKLPQKVRKGKPSFQLGDEDDEAQQESVSQGEGDEPLSELAKKMSFGCASRKGEGEGADADIERAIKLSLDPSFLPQGRAPVGGVTIRDPVSETTPKLPEVEGKGKAIVTEEQVAHSLIDLSKKKRTTDQFILNNRKCNRTVAPKGNKKNKVKYSSTVTSGVGISVRTEDQAGSDPGKAHEALAGPDPEPMQEDQIR